MRRQSPAPEIRSYVQDLGERLPAEARADVLDWLDHNEWLLALEVMADELSEAGGTLEAGEWDRLVALVQRCGGDLARFDMLQPFPRR
ncbi:MafI family immunity protein [Kineosporia babensis]|uniref:MafI family immunity protein n=1 Tax=Kineosporia babensis TaxID=499548 RepID=A0A9X1NKH2_9ACTN|nr:MafI family immunity protein [Kineosporia babensis]MCD5315930.1 MafI family immunity protein [Kineosporia babensis]